MANNLYDNAREQFLTGQIDWTTADVRCALMADTYTPDPVNHTSETDISSDIIDSVTLANKQASADGTATADDVIFTAVTSGSDIASIVVYINGSHLICYIEDSQGFPITPNGEDISVEWDANGIFKI